ncbi:MAG: electron transport complex subunit RsxC [Candidatus Ratteibacteria bacterium]
MSIKIDYSKFGLKKKYEIEKIISIYSLKDLDIFYCKKCFTEINKNIEGEIEILCKILEEKNVNVRKIIGFDFLCNKQFTQNEILKIEEDLNTIGVFSCGLGVQLINEILSNKIILTFSDTNPQSKNATSITGYHGIALGEEKCAACGECYLHLTGGICPIINCAKGLLNGPCGGAKDGKCEVSKEMDCGWIKIFERLKKQKREILKEINIRNYYNFDFSEKNKISKISVKERMENFFGGVHPLENKKNTESLKIENFPSPKYLYIFLSQHTGSPSIPIVKEGERVKLGQKIGEVSGFISSTIHSPVSGKVLSIEEKIHPVSGVPSKCIIIENNFSEEKFPNLKVYTDWENLKKDELIEIIKESGIVGLGGAMFPTHIKLRPPKPVDTLIVNGCECEPYLNCDNRLMIEYPEEILNGIKIVRKILDVKNVIIGIEENKPEAIENMSKVIKNDYIQLKILKTKYPEGAEKLLINVLTGRKVLSGLLPFDVGIIVLNVGTLFSIYKAIFDGIPLIERIVTISGEKTKRPGNFRIKIGTPIKDIFDFCYDIKEEFDNEYELKMGGPMMGIIQKSLDTSVIKGTTGYLLLKKQILLENECIKCGRCLEVCPMELKPLYFWYYGKNEIWGKLKEYNIFDCFECGCCEYICSSKLPILSFIKKGKKCLLQK